MKNKRYLQKLPLILLVLPLVLLLAINNNKNSSNKKTVNEVATVNPTPTSTPYKQNNEQSEKPITKPSAKSEWVTYVNNVYGYEIDIPVGSLLIQEDPDYTRIQNYSFVNDTPGLKKQEYYLEISKSSALKDTYFCKNDLITPETVVIKGITGYKGLLERGGGESATIRYALCIQRNSTNINVIASEESLYFSKKIIDSFRFIN